MASVRSALPTSRPVIPSAHHVVRARREVIVSSGPLNSPKLLHLSGIGPAGVLRDLGIDVRHELSGVGENLHDHYGARGVARIRNSKTANDLSRWPYLGLEILKWLTGRPSIVGLSASIAYVFWKSDEVLDRPDLQFVLTPISFKAGQFGVLDDFPGMSLGVWPHRPQSRGYVRARSTDPLDPPVIQPNYLSSSVDQRTLVAGLKMVRKFLATPQLSHYVEREEVPGPQVATDDEFLDFARRNGSTIYHFAGSNRMGRDHDRMAVVTPDLKVRGLHALRVVELLRHPEPALGQLLRHHPHDRRKSRRPHQGRLIPVIPEAEPRPTGRARLSGTSGSILRQIPDRDATSRPG